MTGKIENPPDTPEPLPTVREALVDAMGIVAEDKARQDERASREKARKVAPKPVPRPVPSRHEKLIRKLAKALHRFPSGKEASLRKLGTGQLEMLAEWHRSRGLCPECGTRLERQTVDGTARQYCWKCRTYPAKSEKLPNLA